VQYKKFRAYKYYPGDLVKPTFKSSVNYGVVLKVKFDILIPFIEVYWQDGSIKKEAEIDIEVVNQIET
jgi:hypothetical protein